MKNEKKKEKRKWKMKVGRSLPSAATIITRLQLIGGTCRRNCSDEEDDKSEE